jgi:hypothetical protein
MPEAPKNKRFRRIALRFAESMTFYTSPVTLGILFLPCTNTHSYISLNYIVIQYYQQTIASSIPPTKLVADNFGIINVISDYYNRFDSKAAWEVGKVPLQPKYPDMCQEL